ncbi:MAG: rod shape-determining protein MreC [Chitinophagaceae bacterium]
MHNLLYLLKRYYHVLLFVVLQIICLSSIIRNSSYQRSSYLNSSRALSGKLLAKKEKIFNYTQLDKINKELSIENAKLKQQIGIQLKKNPLHDTSFDKTLQTDSVIQVTHYHFLPCQVVNNSLDLKNNYLTLNIGSKQGVQKKFVVISDRGVVGEITHVSENYSLASSILSDKFVINAQLPDGTVGKISWNGKHTDFVQLSGISQSVVLKKGDTIYTSSYSKFPEKIMIGTTVKKINNKDYQIKLSNNFQNLHYVYIVEDNTRIERIQLEDSLQVE